MKELAFQKIRKIIFESLNSEKKIEQIKSVLIDLFKGYKEALNGEFIYKGTHVTYFRNMRDKYFNKNNKIS